MNVGLCQKIDLKTLTLREEVKDKVPVYYCSICKDKEFKSIDEWKKAHPTDMKGLSYHICIEKDSREDFLLRENLDIEEEEELERGLPPRASNITREASKLPSGTFTPYIRSIPNVSINLKEAEAKVPNKEVRSKIKEFLEKQVEES